MAIHKHYAKGYYYHVYSCGNQRRDIFRDDSDYSRFTGKIKEYQEKYPVQILAYCLMPSHFHFLLYQPTKLPITKFIQALLVSHVRYFQTKYNLVGHLFQQRFQAKIINTDDNLLNLSRYIHQNPLAAAKNFSDSFLNSYQYSSYSTYSGTKKKSFVKTDLILSYFSKTNPKLDYKTFIKTPMKKEEINKISKLIIESNL